MDISSGEVEFRPLDRPWDPSSQNWRLHFSPDGPSRMTHGTTMSRYLIDIRSRTFRGIAARIRPLEYSEYLTTVYDVESPTVSIDLPRFQLSFILRGDELELKNMRGMVIDDNQSTGTMIGLSSQLVLRNKDPRFKGLPRSRCVLIPHGSVEFCLSPDQNHVRVHIDTRTNFVRQVTWYKYEIDSDLGLLVGSVNLTSRLYKIYLHALCSHPLPDPLTGQTGTDHALQELSAAGCFSFQRLTKADVELLQLIGSITPLRHYPKDPRIMQIMQTTSWSSQLPTLSQHGTFETAVCSILQYARSLADFPGAKDKLGEAKLHLTHSGVSLMTRATHRNAVYYEGVVKVSPEFDKRYNSRDSTNITDSDCDGIEAMNTSRLVYTWPIGLTYRLESSELLKTFQGWGWISGIIPNASLIYTREWLNVNLPAKWLTLYDLCRQVGPSKKFELTFSFAALAYSSPAYRKFIPILLSIATIPSSLLVAPPPHPSYDLKDGFEPTQERVRDMILSRTLYTFTNGPAVPDEKPNKISKVFLPRGIFPRRRINVMLDYAMGKWPCSAMQFPLRQSDDSRWFDIEGIMNDVTKYFTNCSRNVDLLSFATKVTEILDSNYASPPSIGAIVQIPRVCSGPQVDVGIRPLDSPFNLANLLSSRTNSAPLPSTRKFGTGAPINVRHLTQPLDTKNLKKLISQFRQKNHSVLTQLYSERLERSRRELKGQRNLISPEHLPPMDDCLAYLDQCQACLHNILVSIRSALAPSNMTERILANAGLWPRVYSRSILCLLASTANIHLTPEWAKSVIAFAEAFIEYQHSQRLVVYALRSEVDNFFKELDSVSFNRSDAEKNPDWLLIQVWKKFHLGAEFRFLSVDYFQIQGNFITRAIQSDVAHEMITPSSSQNTVLQLNMGEGKSHVIVPLVAVALADSHKLVRVVVLKPLASGFETSCK